MPTRSVALFELLLILSCDAPWAPMEYGTDPVSAYTEHMWKVPGGESRVNQCTVGGTLGPCRGDGGGVWEAAL